MFKLKVKNLKRHETLSQLSLVEAKEYKYVLADDVSLFIIGIPPRLCMNLYYDKYQVLQSPIQWKS